MKDLVISEKINQVGLQFNHINVDPEYFKKWNCNNNDFICLTYDGKLLRNTLYRVGGIGTKDIEGKNYILILKYIEDYYKDSITTDKNRKRHLMGCWCILDKYGNEKFVSKQFHTPHIVDDSIVYAVNENYYNIETGYHYCKSYKVMTSEDYVFLSNDYDDDKSKRGVLQIDKKTGESILFPKK